MEPVLLQRQPRGRGRVAAECTASELRTVGRPAVVSVAGATNGQVPPRQRPGPPTAMARSPHANGQVPNANGHVPNANGQVPPRQRPGFLRQRTGPPPPTDGSPHANGQVHYANGAPHSAIVRTSHLEKGRRRGGSAAVLSAAPA
ncbi:hypothetical protein MRX96_022139 [Rhipicephalus microplus]